MMPRTRNRIEAFTLIEVMIAAAVLTLALTATISVIVNAMLLENQSHELNLAKNAAELQLQRLRGMPYSRLLDDIADPPGDGTRRTGSWFVAGLRVRDGDADGQCGWWQVEKRAGAVNDNLLDIVVRVQWRSRRGGDQVFELRSMRSDRGLRHPSQNP